MTFPVIQTSNTTADTSSASVTVNMPAGIVAGDLLIVICAQDAVGTITQSGGSDWTKLEQNANGSVCSQAIFAKIAAGGDSLTLASTDSQDFSCVALRVSGHGVSNVSTDITKGTAATGSSSTPDPPNCNPGTIKDYLWIEQFSADDDDDTTTYESASYTQVAQIQSASSTTSCLCAVASRNLNAASENPGTMAMAATEEWITQTLAIPPAAVTQQSITFTTDTVLKKANISKTLTADTVLKKTDVSKTFTTDAVLKKTDNLKTFTIDAFLQNQPIEKTFTVDAVLKKPDNSKTFTIDAVLEDSDVSDTLTLDTVLKKNDNSKTFTIDAYLEAGGSSQSHYKPAFAYTCHRYTPSLGYPPQGFY